jgi:hypothetical protein
VKRWLRDVDVSQLADRKEATGKRTLDLSRNVCPVQSKVLEDGRRKEHTRARFKYHCSAKQSFETFDWKPLPLDVWLVTAQGEVQTSLMLWLALTSNISHFRPLRSLVK